MNTEFLQTQISDYFAGERREMIIILIMVPVVMVLAGYLLSVARDRFALGFAAVVFLIGITVTMTTVSLLMRDKKASQELTTAAGSHQTVRAAFEPEVLRMVKVVESYPYYRYGAMILVIVGFVAVFIFKNSLVNGIAAGLLLVASAQFIIDHHSESRATVYKVAIEQYLML